MTPFAMVEATLEAESRVWDDPEGPDAETRYEMIEGRLVEKPSMGGNAGEVALALGSMLRAHVRANGLGRVVIEILFVLDEEGDLRRRPDIAFISAAQWPSKRPSPEGAWNLIPELAVEVISPGNGAAEILGKVREFFDAGARQVWIVYPGQAVIYAYEAFDRILVLAREGELDGGEILPGFKLPLAELFEYGPIEGADEG